MIITRTPFRISLLGGNTDFPEYYKEFGGAFLSTAIDKFIYCIVTKRFDNKIYINYSIKEIVDKVDDIKHDLVRECLKLVGIEGGVEITFLSDIPSEGSGLGSSSAVTVGLLNALYQFTNQPKTNAELASLAVKVEVNELKQPIGVQDQIITAYGGFRYVRLHQMVAVELVKATESTVNKLEDSLMLFYTGKTRKTAKILKGVNLDPKILKKNMKLAQEANIFLENDRPDQIGRLLHKYWLLKKKLNDKVSDKDIDLMYKRARKAGAVGGKIVGAGGGGFLLLYVDPQVKSSVRKAMTAYKELPFRFEKSGTKVIFSI